MPGRRADTGKPLDAGSLADGLYTLTILVSQITNLDGDFDGSVVTFPPRTSAVFHMPPALGMSSIDHIDQLTSALATVTSWQRPSADYHLRTKGKAAGALIDQ